MAKFKFQVLTDVSNYITAKVADAVTDNDVGKSVKLATNTTDTYTICAAGDQIDGFIVGIEPATADGLKLCTINIGGRKRVQISGAANVGDLVEAAAQAAAGTAEANGLPIVAAHTIDTLDTTTLAATMFPKNWRIISANTSDGVVADGDTTVIIELV